ncbi:alpha-1,6-mannosyl-glycoprotein 2-beta-N-acetylglucosaminyltransferase [Caerostris extrusa]|uniref:Alpha-1,6-mannosyl-glycoprotein 2-beta-N-acetylglucosaminyltransferase n=1 Tax=Caerostris extrusa TaxID=172846 RepID=A0AAV4XHP7_CAEEX|nr:alpha-1,6-mannosyl-glycoprotein 2-beta-N-acetylglucosaminyltransferase [Caerostris extrusa]
MIIPIHRYFTSDFVSEYFYSQSNDDIALVKGSNRGPLGSQGAVCQLREPLHEDSLECAQRLCSCIRIEYGALTRSKGYDGMARGWLCTAMLRRCSSHIFKTVILLFVVSFLWLQLRIVNLKPDLFMSQRNHDPELNFFANFSAILNSVNTTTPANLKLLADAIEEVNILQSVNNVEKFGTLNENDVVIVIQVHNRAQYLYALIESLRQAQNINQTLLVFSHDLFDSHINALIQRIDFTKVIQIFYPYSIQLHPNEFPGHDPKDCPRNMKKRRGSKKRVQ